MSKYEKIKTKFTLYCQNCGDIAYSSEPVESFFDCQCGKKTTKFTEDYQLVEENGSIYLESIKKQENGSVDMLAYYSWKENVLVHDRETALLHILISFDKWLKKIVGVKPKYVKYPQEGEDKCVKIAGDVDSLEELLKDKKLSTKQTEEDSLDSSNQDQEK